MATNRRRVRALRTRAARGLALALALAGSPARAELVPVLLVRSASDAPAPGAADEAARALARARAALGSDALVAGPLREALRERYATEPVASDPLGPERERARAARRAWQQHVERDDNDAAQRAIREVDRAATALEANPAALDASAESRRALELSLLFLAERHEAAGSHALAEEAMRRLARSDPAVLFTATSASPAVQRYYQRAVAELPRGALTVEASPAGCVVLRDGREAGAAPVELQDLAPGPHRIALRCGALASLVHTVTVAARTRATLALDARRDAALRLDDSEPSPALVYDGAASLRQHLGGDLSALSRALGARRALALDARERRAQVVDVPSGALVGSASLDDETALRALLRAPAPEPAPSALAAAPVPSGPARAASPARGGFPAGAPVLWGLGLAVGGGALYAYLHANDLEHGAYQSALPGPRAQQLDELPYWRVAQWSAVGLGGALLVAGTVVALAVRAAPPSSSASARGVRPHLALDGAGLSLHF